MPAACRSAERRRASGSAAPAALSMLLQQGQRPAVSTQKQPAGEAGRRRQRSLGGTCPARGSATPGSEAESGAGGAPERCEHRHICAVRLRRRGRGKGRLAHT